MKTFSKLFFYFVTVLILASAVPCYADLTATVTPGYVFTAGEIPTTAKLNQAATPSILISGSVNGSTGLSAKSVNGTHLADNVVDGVTLDYNGSSPRSIEIANGGVGVSQLNAAVAGNGLTGGGGSALAVNVDGVTIKVTNDVVTIGTISVTNIPGAGLTLLGSGTNSTNGYIGLGSSLAFSGTNLILTNFTTPAIAYPVGAGTVATVSHSFTNKPRIVEWVVVCTNTDAGYAAGDEVATSAFGNTINDAAVFVPGYNATSLFLVFDGRGAQIHHKSTGADTAITPINWNLKCYAFQ